MIELLRKEIRALRPMMLLIVAFFAALFIYGMAAEFPDLPQDSTPDNEAIGMLIFLSLFASMAGASLLISESNDGTLRFLDALPLSRTRIFLAKIIAGIAVLQLAPVLSMGLDAFSKVVEHNSLSPAVHWRPVVTTFAQQSITSIYLLSLAVLLSFTRRWFTLAVGFVFWGFLWLRVNRIAWITLFDPYELISFTSPGIGARFPWHHARAALGVSAVSLAIAWLCFQSLGDRIQHATERARRWRLAGAARFVGVVLIPVVWIGAFYYLGRKVGQPPRDPGDLHSTEQFFASAQTKRFDFVYRESDRAAANELIAGADGIHDKVMNFLGASPVPGRIVVDLGGAVIEHAAGQTNWTKIRVPLGLGLTKPQLRAVLGHETTHVYIDQLNDGAMVRQFKSARFFHEGLATFVEHKFFSTDEERLRMHRLAAAAASRGRVPFETLVSNEALSKERDGNLVYPLGEVFCEALVATHGDDAPGRLLRAFARRGAPAGLDGSMFWRDAMQSCGFSLDRVIAAYDAGLARAMEQEAGFIARFPKLTGRVEVAGGEVLVHSQFDGTAPGKIVCMLNSPFGPQIFDARDDGVVHLPRSQYPGAKLRYTLGWASKELPWPLFDAWTEASIE